MSNVKPMAVVAAYACDSCGYEVFQDVTSQSWTPLTQCESPACKQNGTRGQLHMQTRASKFLKFQEVKLQETTEQVPVGHIPRYMTIHVTEDLTRTMSPGDSVTISGVILPVPFVGYKALRAGLITDTYLDAHFVIYTLR